MHLAMISRGGEKGLAIRGDDGIKAIFSPDCPDLDAMVAQGSAIDPAFFDGFEQVSVNEAEISFLPPLSKPPKIICVGLNYRDHASEVAMEVPEFPTIFARFASGLIGHGAPIVKPLNSDQLDFEGEMVAVIGKGGRNIARDAALRHIAGYSIFNDGSIRDFQMRTPQWTAGKNFDDTGAFGPWFVTADALPAGGAGLHLETRLNGEVVQSASTDDMMYTVTDLIVLLSNFMTLEAGDMIVSGTPAGVGMGRTPPLWMKPGDVCEIEIEGIGILRNPVVLEAAD